MCTGSTTGSTGKRKRGIIAALILPRDPLVDQVLLRRRKHCQRLTASDRLQTSCGSLAIVRLAISLFAGFWFHSLHAQNEAEMAVAIKNNFRPVREVRRWKTEGEYGTNGNNGTDGSFSRVFRLFRYFRLFRILSGLSESQASSQFFTPSHEEAKPYAHTRKRCARRGDAAAVEVEKRR
jgi:hypothetical protein